MKAFTKCQHDGCTATEYIEEYSIWGYDPAPVFVFCPEHAAAFGFCLWCGAFIGGTEDIFKTGQSGLCFDCFIEMEEETHAYYNDEYDYED